MQDDYLGLLDELQNRIGYRFKDSSLLKISLTHKSSLNEPDKGEESNERMEFLGDAVIELCVSHYLYKEYPNMAEGKLAKARAATVCEPSLAESAIELELGDCIVLGKGEEVSGGREKLSILSDSFEAIIGAIYLDGGFDAAQEVILDRLQKTLKMAVKGKVYRDYKTELQEILQKKRNGHIKYSMTSEQGPAHNKLFEMCVVFGEKVLGKGSGRSKKEAEQNAAKQAIDSINKKKE